MKGTLGIAGDGGGHPVWKKVALSWDLQPILGSWYLLLTPSCGISGKGREGYKGSVTIVGG